MRPLLTGGAALCFGAALSAASCGRAPSSEPAAPPLATPSADMARPAPTRASATPAFVAAIATGYRIESDASRLAQSRVTDQRVREFAHTTQREAETALSGFVALATAAEAPAPTELDASARAAIEAVRASAAPTFEAHYLDTVIQTREAMIDELERYAGSGTSPALRAFAADALPTLRARLQEADTLRQSVNVQPDAASKD